MRICLLTSTFLPALGGAERSADVIVRGLIERGHEVTVLAPRTGEPEPHLPYEVRRYRMPPAPHLWPEALAWPLWRLHRRKRFDLVFAFYSYPTGYAATFLRRRTGVPVVISARGADVYPHYHALGRPRVKQVIAAGYQRANRVVAISRWCRDRIHEIAGDDLPPIDVVYHGLDLADYDRRRAEALAHPPDLPVRRPFVVHVGRVAPVKRQTLAMRAVAKARDAFEQRGVQYVIVGDGPDMPEVRRLIDEHRLHDIVVPVGVRDGPAKLWLQEQADFAVTASRDEAFGWVVLEAMAAGTPVLASDIGSHPELVDELGVGRLFRCGDVDDLADQLRRMLAADLTPLAARALEARQQFTLSKMIDGYEAACHASL